MLKLYELYCKLGKNQIITKYIVKRFCCGMWCYCGSIAIGMGGSCFNDG